MEKMIHDKTRKAKTGHLKVVFTRCNRSREITSTDQGKERGKIIGQSLKNTVRKVGTGSTQRWKMRTNGQIWF